QAQPQLLPGNQDKLANLKTLYPNHNIVSDGNGKYSATDKDGNLIGQGLSYEEMCKALAKTKETNTTPTPVDDDDDDNNSTQTNTGNNTVVQGNDTGNDDNTVVQNNGNNTVGHSNGSKVNNGNRTESVNNNQKPIDKSKPVTVNISFSIHSNTTNSGTATVIMPDGTRYTASTTPSLTHNRAMDSLANDIMSQLKAAGWTNVTLTNQNFKFSKGGQATQATQNTQNANQAQNANKTQWTAAEKAKPRKLTINFSIHTLRGNNGSATVTTPDGQKFTVTTDMSLTQQRAMADLSNKMKAQLSQAGWTNTTLVNPNFNWSD
ncbi:MAG: hypothetical protein K2F57_03895, partial [Candidatus Gastranaerophilales bacterium]|nr:hypothetical protein [Candidatus Gastranaerophilales bacterium]